jgi:genome maintenance exonuclease 1
MTKFIDYDIPKIEQINSESGRRYKTPNGNLYPSVTTILGQLNKDYLNEWIAKVGVKEAEKIRDAAGKRGTRMHDLCEKYLRGQSYELNPFETGANTLFKQMIPYLNKFEVVHALETQLYSDKLKVAGTVDCIADINGIRYIVDFKSSTGIKSREDIPAYFMQVAAYSMMWYERTGQVVTQSKILISTEEGCVLEYDENIKPWIIKFKELRDLYVG